MYKSWTITEIHIYVSMCGQYTLYVYNQIQIMNFALQCFGDAAQLKTSPGLQDWIFN